MTDVAITKTLVLRRDGDVPFAFVFTFEPRYETKNSSQYGKHHTRHEAFPVCGKVCSDRTSSDRSLEMGQQGESACISKKTITLKSGIGLEMVSVPPTDV